MTYRGLSRKMAAAIGVAGMLCNATSAFAATQSVTANISFDVAITLTKNSDIAFGYVTALQANSYTITTAGVVTTSGGAGTGVPLGGTKTAGNITVAGSTIQTVDISAANYTANAGVTPSAAMCAYNGGAAAACNTLTAQAAPAAGKTLLIGVTVTADGTQAANTSAAPTFDIIVNYT